MITKIPYPKAGTTNSAARIGVVSAEGGPTTWIKTEGDPRNTYLARIGWIDASTVAIQQLNRLQNRNDFLSADVKSGAVKRIFRDESKQWVDINEDVPWIDGGRTFLWQSEKNGWNQVYQCRAKAERPGDHEVRRRRHRHRRLRREGRVDVLPRLARQRRPAVSLSFAS